MTPEQLEQMTDECWTAIEEIARKHGIEGVERDDWLYHWLSEHA